MAARIENAVSGDKSAQVPGGVRLGTSALTSRNLGPTELRTVASFLHRAVQLALVLQKEAGSKLLKDFVRVAREEGEAREGWKAVRELRREVRAFARRWPVPGVVGEIKRPAGILEDD